MIINNFNINPNKSKIFNIIELDENSPVYDEINQMFNELTKDFISNISPIALFDIFKEEKTAYCLLSLGDKISLIYDEIFQNGEYMKSLLLDAMCDDYIFQMDYIVTAELEKIFNNLEIFNFQRVDPFIEVNPEYQKKIVDKLNASNFGVNVNDCFVLSPVKSVSFIIRFDDTACGLSKFAHSCSKCENKTCKWRK